MSTQARPLGGVFHVRRRYSRSINLERDLFVPGTLDGYITSPLALDAVQRVVESWATPEAPKAWTVTGVYGTGKSAFAHFLCSFMAGARSTARREALKVLASSPEGEALARRLRKLLAGDAVLFAVATGQRESLAMTVLRALERGTRQFWDGAADARPKVLERLHAVAEEARKSGSAPARKEIVELALEVARVSEGGLLLVIDELGKCLEYAARDTSGADDVFLLQQLAESTVGDPQFGIVGLLHQGFGEYGAGLAMDRRTEWLKVQGRFEDIVFTQPPEQMLRLVASAIEHDAGEEITPTLRATAGAWSTYLQGDGFDHHVREVLSPELVEDVLPLHPVAALILPSLCAKYAQNDRSLFTFLASQEPHAFGRFLREAVWNGSGLPLQRLNDVYDYFAGIAGQAMGFRPQFQRWAEVHAVVSDARNLDPDSVAAIKTIAALNLTAASGPLRASRALTIAALAEAPEDPAQISRWEDVLENLVSRGLITYRRQLDEYRLWEGSDFDVEAAIRARLARSQMNLAAVLTDAVPLAPVVAQRHSYRTGTLRYFERSYVDDADRLVTATCESDQSDGVLLYWIGESLPKGVPPSTPDGRPLVVVVAREISMLGDAAAEYMALEEISRSDPHLQVDGVARREVRHRQRIARAALDHAVRDSLFRRDLECLVAGERVHLSPTELKSRLSDVCDQVYPGSLTLWNELINRRDLTSQGAKARRVLIEAMLKNGSQPRLGLKGNGPETSIYAAVLERSGIHRREGDRWVFGPPTDSGFTAVWEAIETYCHQANGSPQSVDELFALLQRPPYGAKAGALPILVTAALLSDSDSLSLYREGSFIPSLGAEHFEVLVKHPDKFAIKYFSLDGLRGDVFRDLEEAVRSATRGASGEATRSILGVVRPLVQFASALPQVTLKSSALAPETRAVRDALLTAREPDRLIFESLPVACGLPEIVPGATADPELRAEYRTRLLGALRELQAFQDRRRKECRNLLHAAFGISEDPLRLRDDLRQRVSALGTRPLEDRLRAFVVAAGDEKASDLDWLDALVMVVSDRPLRNWSDDDAAAFEGRVADFARRFRNLEAIHVEAGAITPGDDVRRMTVTGPDGRDVHRIVWIPARERGEVDKAAGSVIAHLEKLPAAQREAVLAMVTESVLANGRDDAAVNSDTSDPDQESLYAGSHHA